MLVYHYSGVFEETFQCTGRQQSTGEGGKWEVQRETGKPQWEHIPVRAAEPVGTIRGGTWVYTIKKSCNLASDRNHWQGQIVFPVCLMGPDWQNSTGGEVEWLWTDDSLCRCRFIGADFDRDQIDSSPLLLVGATSVKSLSLFFFFYLQKILLNPSLSWRGLRQT